MSELTLLCPRCSKPIALHEPTEDCVSCSCGLRMHVQGNIAIVMMPAAMREQVHQCPRIIDHSQVFNAPSGAMLKMLRQVNKMTDARIKKGG